MTDVIGTEQVAKATALLQRYKTGKAEHCPRHSNPTLPHG